MTKVPQISLLGISDRVKRDQTDPPYLSQTHIIGLRNGVVGYIYPLDLSQFSLILSIYGIEKSIPGAISFRNREGNEIYHIKLSTVPHEDIQVNSKPNSDDSETGICCIFGDKSAWTMTMLPLIGLILYEPQILEVFLHSEDEEMPLGKLIFLLAETPPLSIDRIAAIKSDPRAIKLARMILGCKYCDSKLSVITALVKSDIGELDGVWYEDLPDQFLCSCGKTNMPLGILRTNMYSILGLHNVNANNLTYSALYQQDTLDRTSEKFFQLIKNKPKEELVQRFLSENPILFHFLSPVRIFEKPPILSKYQADFAILDSRGTLIFIEIERPDILLLRKDGAASAEIEHAISQVRDWLYQYEKHRPAVIECLDLTDREVTRVKGLVIAGRDEGCDAENLRKFKWQDRGLIDCYTYDDLLGIFAALNRDMKAV